MGGVTQCGAYCRVWNLSSTLELTPQTRCPLACSCNPVLRRQRQACARTHWAVKSGIIGKLQVSVRNHLPKTKQTDGAQRRTLKAVLSSAFLTTEPKPKGKGDRIQAEI